MERRLEAIRTEKSKVPAELVPRGRQQDHRDATSLTKVRKYEASCSLVWDMEWLVWRGVPCNRIVTKDRSSGIDLICSGGSLDENTHAILPRESINFPYALIILPSDWFVSNLHFFAEKETRRQRWYFYDPKLYIVYIAYIF